MQFFKINFLFESDRKVSLIFLKKTQTQYKFEEIYSNSEKISETYLKGTK